MKEYTDETTLVRLSDKAEAMCKECGDWNGGTIKCKDCIFNAIKQALDLIDRQKAEIEALRQRLAETENGYEQTLYLERVKNNLLTAENNRLGVWEQGKVEAVRNHAVKQFADRLKPRIDCEYGEKFYRDKCFEEIDSLVKEMTGEQ